jgi:hypothetical protein
MLDVGAVTEILSRLPPEGSYKVRGERLYTQDSENAPLRYRGSVWDRSIVDEALAAVDFLNGD